MQTIIVEIINQKALKLLKDLEGLNLIKVVSDKKSSPSLSAKFKGKLSKKTAKALQKHVSDTRNEWEKNI